MIADMPELTLFIEPPLGIHDAAAFSAFGLASTMALMAFCPVASHPTEFV